MLIYVVAALIVLVLLYLHYRYPFIRIIGYSMYPTYMDGDYLIGKRISPKEPLSVGSVYVFKPPYESEEQKRVIKRLCYIDFVDNSMLFFLGDNADDSFDSRDYGLVPRKNIVAVVVKKVGKN